MFWQAFVCGVGGALGACIVVLTFVTIFVRPKKSEREESLELTRTSVAELRRRNDLSEGQHTILWRIVEALETKGN